VFGDIRKGRMWERNLSGLILKEVLMVIEKIQVKHDNFLKGCRIDIDKDNVKGYLSFRMYEDLLNMEDKQIRTT
jgi:hypothetical protein